MTSRTYGPYTVNVNSGLVSPSPVALLPSAFCRDSPEVSREPRFVGATSPPSHITAPKASDAIRRSAVLPWIEPTKKRRASHRPKSTPSAGPVQSANMFLVLSPLSDDGDDDPRHDFVGPEPDE